MNGVGAYAEMNPLEVAPRIRAFRILDVREDHEFRGPLGHIDGAELLRRSQWDEVDALPPNCGPILVVCRSGRRSAEVCARIAERASEPPTNLSGGMIRWNQSGLPVVRTVAESAAELVDAVISWSAGVRGRLRDDEFRAFEEQCAELGHGLRTPDRETAAALIRLVGDSMAESRPADLDLAMSAFRHSLASL